MNENKFFSEWLRLTVALREPEKGRLIDAIASYAINGDVSDKLVGLEKPIFPIFINLINEEQKKGKCEP